METSDPLYPEVEQWTKTQEVVSITRIQRQFRVSYFRAARLIDELERNGIIDQVNTEHIRKVLKG